MCRPLLTGPTTAPVSRQALTSTSAAMTGAAAPVKAAYALGRRRPRRGSKLRRGNAEARLVRHNLLHPYQPKRAHFALVPSAVFADPQIASAGATEQELQAEGRPYSTATRRYGDTAYGWALEDTTALSRSSPTPGSRLLLGAHIVGPQAATLIQPLIQAMCLGNTIEQVAGDVLYIHPALTEAVEQALLEL